MDNYNMKATLSNYKKILGDGCDDYISQQNQEMLLKVTGKAHFLNYMGFLLNIIEYIEDNKNNGIFSGLYMQQYEEIKVENDKLVALNNELAKKVKSLEHIIDTYNKCYLQQTKLKTGKKIAYKEQISAEEVRKLKKEGLSTEQMAEKLGVSKSTIWRRLKEKV